MKKKKANPKELVNKLIVEIGLDIDTDNNIVDQDTQNSLVFNGKKLKYVPGDQKVNRNEIEFDPISNRKLMTNLLAYANNKQVEEGTAAPISIFYQLNSNQEGKNKIELKDENNNVYVSNPYYNDNLKLMDILFQMNGEQNVDLSEYDERIK